MARENQGLQIALIIFVMLTIILGVTTFLFFRNWQTEAEKAAKSLAELGTSRTLAAKNDEDANTLKRLIGVAPTDKVEEISTTKFNEDMKKYGSSYPEEVRFYRPLLEKMSKTIDEKNAQVASAKEENEKLKREYAEREATKDAQLKKFEEEREKAGKDLASEIAKFSADRGRIAKDQTQFKTDLESAAKEAAAKLDKVDKEVQDAKAQYQELRKVNKTLTAKQEQLTSQKVEVPEGEIVWANQRTGMVWINLGRADNLQRQVTFAVYPADVTDMARGGKKANIEVTRVLGDHLAEARAFDDRLIDPITPGDKIYTPVWTPGEKRHFALAGFMELDGSGHHDLDAVINLITMNGGVVDSYIDDKGTQHGEVTVNTRYLVLGEKPTEKGKSALLDAFSKMIGDAERFGVQRIQLGDLLQRMGWKNQTPVVPYGGGMKSRDFSAKPEEGGQKKSTGNVSDVFQPRVPPARIPIGTH